MIADQTELLERLPLFRFFSPEDVERTLPLFKERTFSFGEVIAEAGKPGDALYVIVEGRARQVKRGADGKEVQLNVYRPGDSFNELAILQNTVRASTVRASGDVTCLCLDRKDLEALAAKNPQINEYIELRRRQRSLQYFLHERSVFGNLPLPALKAFLQHLEPVEFEKGAIITKQGDPPGPMYIIEEGQIRVHKSKNGQDRQLAFYRAGDYFGELATIRGTDSTANVEAVTDCRLQALSSDTLLDLMEQYPEFKDLVHSRIEGYQSMFDARMPLDFAEELLPADSRIDKVEMDETIAPPKSPEAPKQEPFATPEGLFKRKGRIRRFPFVRQIDEMDCGAAALAMVCRHFGKRISLTRIRQLAHTAYDGTSLKAIIHAATELGLAARAVRVAPHNLELMPTPAIVHYDGNHWVVLVNVKKNRVQIADPGVGVRWIKRDEFEQRWTGYAALFDYTVAFKEQEEGRAPWTWSLPFLAPYKWTLLQVLLLAMVGAGLQLLLPVFTQVIVDRVIVENDVAMLRMLVIAMVFAMVFMLAANVIQRFMLSFAAIHVDVAILDFLTRKMLALPMTYFNTRRTGDILNRLEGAREVREFIVHSGIGGLLAVVQIVAYLSIMAVYSVTLFLVYLIAAPLYVGLMYFSRRVLGPLFDKLIESYALYSSRQIDAIRGIEVVKVAAAEAGFRDKMLNEFLGVSRTQFRSNFVVMLYEAAVQGVGFFSTILFLWVGANLVMNGEMTIGGFVAFNAVVAMSYTPILTVLRLWDDLQRATVHMNRLNDILEYEPEQGWDRSHLIPVPTLEGRVQLNNVSFHYGGPGSADILKKINLDVPPGKTVAIVGRSGSGKTTFIKLLSGLLEPTEGAVLYDGIDLKTLNFRELRKNIGAVFQENYLFTDTIMNNIAFGDPEPDLQRIIWAARMANAHGFISRLPLGYETKVGESGLAISGGQRQRIAIARALYPDPPILIFDEATSALDTESEQSIQQNLTQILQRRTTFIVAHRLSTVRDADVIIVLENGEIVEQGNHDELMALRGLYHYLCSQQLGL